METDAPAEEAPAAEEAFAAAADGAEPEAPAAADEAPAAAEEAQAEAPAAAADEPMEEAPAAADEQEAPAAEAAAEEADEAPAAAAEEEKTAPAAAVEEAAPKEVEEQQQAAVEQQDEPAKEAPAADTTDKVRAGSRLLLDKQSSVNDYNSQIPIQCVRLACLAVTGVQQCLTTSAHLVTCVVDQAAVTVVSHLLCGLFVTPCLSLPCWLPSVDPLLPSHHSLLRMQCHPHPQQHCEQPWLLVSWASTGPHSACTAQ